MNSLVKSYCLDQYVREMKKADIYIGNHLCGLLSEDNNGFHFKYDSEYMDMEGAEPISPTMPFQEKEYTKEMMFPVFDGIIPEGWLLNIATNNWKLDPRDRMSLLIECCKDCIGNISVKRHE